MRYANPAPTVRAPNPFPLLAVLVSLIAADLSAAEASSPSGRLVEWQTVGPISKSAGTHPLFAHWAVHQGRPLVIEFRAAPETDYQVFLTFTEAYWKEAGHRIVDVRVGGEKVDSLDTFHRAPNVAHGRLYRCRSDGDGRIRIEIAPSPGSPDTNPVLCGALLFRGTDAVGVEDVVANRGPAPLASVGTSPEDAARYRAALYGKRGLYFAKKRYDPDPLPEYETTRDRLPRPIFDEEPGWVAMDDAAWRIAFTRMRSTPTTEAGARIVTASADRPFTLEVLWKGERWTAEVVPGLETRIELTAR